MKKTATANSFESFRHSIKRNNKLDAASFQELTKLCKTDKIADYLKQSMTNKEMGVLGRAIMKSKRLNVSSLLPLVMTRNSQNTFLLTCILLKRSRIEDLSEVISYIKDVISEDSPKLCCFNILLVLFRNYPLYFDEELKKFCEENDHPICREISKSF